MKESGPKPVGRTITFGRSALEYSFEDPNQQGVYVCSLDFIHSTRRGDVERLVAELRSRLGPNYPIVGYVIEENTRKLFREKGLLAGMLSEPENSRREVPKSLYLHSKFIGQLINGGIDIEKVEVVRDTDSEAEFRNDGLPVSIEFEGRTK
jgi:hypothetical protein